MKIKEWKIKEIAINNMGGFLESVNRIEKETEKAYLLSITWGYCSSLSRELKVWCPKSAVISDEEYAEIETKVTENGLEYNKKLVEFAKNCGIKGIRKGLKTATLIKKISDAGFEVPARV